MQFWMAPVFFVLLAFSSILAKHTPWPGEIILSLLPQIGITAIIVALLLIGLGRPIFGFAVMSCAAIFFVQADGMLPFGQKQAGPNGLKIYWANVFAKADAFEKAISNARDQGVDIIMIAETPFQSNLEKVAASLPEYEHIRGSIAHDDAAISVFSRISLQNFESIPVEGRKSVVFDIEKNGTYISIVAVHPTIPTSPRRTLRRNAHILTSAERLSSKNHKVMLGDFNAVPWSPVIGEAKSLAKLRRIPSSNASTWISTLPGIGLPLDLVFVSENISAEAHAGVAIGSDHFPLIVDVSIAQSLADEIETVAKKEP